MIDNCKIIGNWQLLIANCFNFAIGSYEKSVIYWK